MTTQIQRNDPLLRRIVRAIDKAIADDVPRIRQEMQLETDNYVRFIRSDCIHDNLKTLAVSEDVQIIPFKRYSWKGRMLVDHANRITYSITTRQNLDAIPKKKDRRAPHFLMSMLAVENGDLEGQYEQLTLFPMDQFDEETYEEDYDTIINGALDPSAGYRHYVITYEFTGETLLEVDVVFLDKNFTVIDKESIREYIKPDFARLTGSAAAPEDAAENKPSIKNHLSLKPGLKQQLYEEEKQA